LHQRAGQAHQRPGLGRGSGMSANVREWAQQYSRDPTLLRQFELDMLPLFLGPTSGCCADLLCPCHSLHPKRPLLRSPHIWSTVLALARVV
jgi:hypothetical protein